MRLSEILKEQTDAHVVTIVGTDSAKVKAETMNSLVNILPDEQLIIIATGTATPKKASCGSNRENWRQNLKR